MARCVTESGSLRRRWSQQSGREEVQVAFPSLCPLGSGAFPILDDVDEESRHSVRVWRISRTGNTRGVLLPFAFATDGAVQLGWPVLPPSISVVGDACLMRSALVYHICHTGGTKCIRPSSRSATAAWPSPLVPP